MSSSRYPAPATSPYWGNPVASAASLPASGRAVGELRLALDTDDLYEWNGSTWERITQNSADVSGPGSSTDNALARFDGTTGKVLQNSGATLSDAGVLTAAGFVGDVTGNVSGTSGGLSVVNDVAHGGTNSSAALSNNRVIKSASGAIVEAAAITASRALVSDANGIPTHSSVTTTEIGYVSGVTSAIQTQLNAKLALAGGTMVGDLVLAGDPDSALKAATKQYVDSVAAGLSVKQSVLIATTANITLSGLQTIDGVLTIAGDRVLVKNQTAPAENGIYLSAVGAWTRSTDMDSWAEVPGTFCFVEQGSLYADTAFVCTADPGGTLGVTAITWSQFAGAGTYSAGTGLTLTGTQFSITALTASRAVVTDGSGNRAASTTTATEIGYVNGVTSAIQTQINNTRAFKSQVSVSGDVTLTDTALHLVDTSAARSLTLPSPSATRFLIIKDVTGSCDTNNITLVRNGSEKIETVTASYTLDTALGSWTIVSDGTDWFIL